MMASILFGKIKSSALESWDKVSDPYDILENDQEVSGIGAWDFMSIGKKIFGESKQIDWGSYAYKCNRTQLQQLVEQTGCSIKGLDEMNESEEYAIVFIEQP